MEAGGLGVWMRIGYIIHELTTEVHDALSKKDILMDLIHVQRL